MIPSTRIAACQHQGRSVPARVWRSVGVGRVGLLVLVASLASCTILNRYIPIQSAPSEVSSAGFRLPANGRVTSTFGIRTLLGTTRPHKGIDFEGEYLVGPVFAAADGVVSISQTSETYGEWIEIKHPNGYATRYAHMVWRHASAGAEVKQGDVIGRFGSTGRSTGTHLHFEILRNGSQIDPLPLIPKVVVVGSTVKPMPAPAAPPAAKVPPTSEPKPAKGTGKSKKPAPVPEPAAPSTPHPPAAPPPAANAPSSPEDE